MYYCASLRNWEIFQSLVNVRVVFIHLWFDLAVRMRDSRVFVLRLGYLSLCRTHARWWDHSPIPYHILFIILAQSWSPHVFSSTCLFALLGLDHVSHFTGHFHLNRDREHCRLAACLMSRSVRLLPCGSVFFCSACYGLSFAKPFRDLSHSSCSHTTSRPFTDVGLSL